LHQLLILLEKIAGQAAFKLLAMCAVSDLDPVPGKLTVVAVVIGGGSIGNDFYLQRNTHTASSCKSDARPWFTHGRAEIYPGLRIHQA
jgi:hypothetical protein